MGSRGIEGEERRGEAWAKGAKFKEGLLDVEMLAVVQHLVGLDRGAQRSWRR